MAAAILGPVVAAGVLGATDGAIAVMLLETAFGQPFSSVANLPTIMLALDDVSSATVPNAPAVTKPNSSIRPCVIVR